jgi:hypothetical protein
MSVKTRAAGVIDVLGETYLPGWELMRAFFQSVPCGDGPPDALEGPSIPPAEKPKADEMLLRDRLMLVTAAGPRELSEADVALIRQRRGDSLQDGAIIGAAAGAGYGLAMLTFWRARARAAGRFLPALSLQWWSSRASARLLA